MLLAERRDLEINEQMLDEIANNREKDYGAAAYQGHHLQLGFLQHSLMISRVLSVLRWPRESREDKLISRPGARVRNFSVLRLKYLTSSRVAKGISPSGKSQAEANGFRSSPMRCSPSILQTGPPEPQLVHFFYEADRGTMNACPEAILKTP